ncbi:unnamed protein product [Onchocerca flexuosa]|uniref:SH3 domain-containing protein n=1 Tax=Onchocerca flexuosa TaxID=387005 RepID=A0A183HFJ9_9BILA|nr:unnamed protein product [Onchocerca flexuosa]
MKTFGDDIIRRRGQSNADFGKEIRLLVICLDIPGEEMLITLIKKPFIKVIRSNQTNMTYNRKVENVYKISFQTWLPPSPPPSDNGDDIYYDSTGEYWFEQLPMAESRLPTTIHELHRPRPLTPTSSLLPEQFVPEIIAPSSIPYQLAPGVVPPNVAMPPIVALPPSPTGMCTVASGIVRDIVSSPTASLSSLSHERSINLIPQTGVSTGAAYLDTSNLLRPATPSRLPGSVDDAIDSVRKSAQKAASVQGTHRSQVGSGRPGLLDSRCGKAELRRPFTPPPRYREAIDYEGSEWSIAEDYEALMILTELQRLPNHLHSAKIGQYANWDMVSVLLATSSEIYR